MDGTPGAILPIGLLQYMGVREDAMDRYLQMSEEEKAAIAAKSRHVTSREEMEHLVQMMAEGKFD